MHKALTSKKVISLLERNGFVLRRTRGSHFIFAHPQLKRRVIVLSHARDVPVGTLLSIIKQAGITRDDLQRRG